MRHVLLSLLLITAGCATITAPKTELTLAKRGATATYTIVHAAGAGESILLACNELQSAIAKQTGVTLPIQDDTAALPSKAILIGEPRYLAELPGCQFPEYDKPDDSFSLKVVGPHLVIHGGKRGALYGVCEVLERFGGCRWYASWHTVMPELQEFTVPVTLNETQIPAFLMRESFWYDQFNTEMAYHNKSNGNAMRLDKQHGGKVRFGSGLFVHTFDQLIPVDEFFKTHPEYFSEIGGRRSDGYVQRCLSNPDVLKIMTERMIERIRKDPDATMYSLSQNDVYNFCTCKNCNALAEKYGGQSGLLIWFVNQVAEAVEKEFPNALIETLAYQYTRTPPVNIQPRHNVVPRLCTIECDFASPLDVSTDPQNQKFVKDIKGWSSMTDKLFIWDYTTNFNNYLGPFPNFGCLQGNIRFFRDNHVIGLMEQGAYQGYHAEFAELRGWLLAKLLWNPEQNVDALVDDFMKGYYGAAAPLVRKYFDELQSLVNSPEKHINIWFPMHVEWLTDDFLLRSTELWKQAEELVKDDPILRYNVRKSSIPVYYARYERIPKPLNRYWEDDGIHFDPAQQAIVRELLTRFDEVGPEGVGKLNIIIRESGNAEHTNWVQEAADIPVVNLKSGSLKATVAPSLGGQVGILKDKDGFNFLNGNKGGALLVVGPSTTQEVKDIYKVVEATDSALTMVHETKELAATQNMSLIGNDLQMELKIRNKTQEARQQKYSAYFACNLGKTASYCWKLDNGPWKVFTPEAGAINDFVSIKSAELTGKQTLTIASAATGKAMTLKIPELPERLFLQIWNRSGNIDIAFFGAAQELAANATLSRQFVLTPSMATDLPKVSAPAAQGDAKNRVLFQDANIPINRPGFWGDYVIDQEATDLAAVKMFNTHYEWCIQFKPCLLDRSLVESGKTYRVRARVRIDPRSAEGEALWGGIYNPATQIYVANMSVSVKEAKSGYQWVTIAEHWKPDPIDVIWMGPGRFGNGTPSAINGVYLDCVECTEE